MAHTEFPERARRGDTLYGHMTVQRMLEFLRDAFDGFAGSIVRGTTTLTSGTTTVIVAHGLGKAIYSAVVTPVADPGGRFWISNKTGTQFQINVSAAPGINVPFDWVVKGA